VLKVFFFFTSVKNTFNTVSYKEQFLIKLASTKNPTFNVSCIKKYLSILSIVEFFTNVTNVSKTKINYSLGFRDIRY
jgi:hypothetical protein